MIRKLIRNGIEMVFFSEMRADAGYYFLELEVNDGAIPRLVYHPIIGWALESGTYQQYPIILNGLVTEKIAILAPNGIVFTPLNEGYCLNVSDWLAEQNVKATHSIGAPI
ncbi:hypothetical protein H8K32_19880 [Undibacterium jejuense]|uniref:Uncharacterized protein n=1 Tax=Undibacterium jejuense TaxID=1344949 RepID=A0A923HHW8_9BURK|nr:hypothetical protein [Undibacterium jejuense]MBC3864361.1 hypothetical protein [Undibacterium jejuense]